MKLLKALATLMLLGMPPYIISNVPPKPAEASTAPKEDLLLRKKITDRLVPEIVLAGDLERHDFATMAGLPVDILQVESTEVEFTLSTADFSEVLCVAQVVFTEARGEPEEGQYAVAQVVKNRAEDTDPRAGWAKTVCGVAKQTRGRSGYEFDGMRDVVESEKRGKRWHPNPHEYDAWKLALRIAYDVLSGEYALEGEITRATFYYNPQKTHACWQRRNTVWLFDEGRHDFGASPQNTFEWVQVKESIPRVCQLKKQVRAPKKKSKPKPSFNPLAPQIASK